MTGGATGSAFICHANGEVIKERRFRIDFGFNMIRHAIPKKAIRRNTLGTWRPTDFASIAFVVKLESNEDLLNAAKLFLKKSLQTTS